MMVLNGLFDCNLDTELCEMKARNIAGYPVEAGLRLPL